MLYILCLLSVLLLSYIADKRERKIYIFLCALILSAFCGLRSVGTGVDTKNYYNFLSYIRGSGIGFGSDIGFSVVSYFLMGIFDNPYYPLLFFATITNFLIVYRLWDFRNEASLSLMLMLYMVVYYPYTFNIVRQFLAISLVFWATRYIEREEYKKYIIFNILATTFHTSALMCFSYLFVKFGNGAKKKKYRILGFGVAALFVVAGLFLFSANVSKYESYLVSSGVSIHAMTILKIACWLLVVIINRVYQNMEFSITKNGEIVPMQRQLPTMYTFMNRIGFYFIMYELPFWGQAVRARVNRSIYRAIILFIIGYVLVTSFMIERSADNLLYYQSFLSH